MMASCLEQVGVGPARRPDLRGSLPEDLNGGIGGEVVVAGEHDRQRTVEPCLPTDAGALHGLAEQYRPEELASAWSTIADAASVPIPAPAR